MPSFLKQTVAEKMRAAHEECKRAEEEIIIVTLQDEYKKREEKKRIVPFMISGPRGLVSRCNLPIDTVLKYGISILRVFMTIENEFYARLIINPIIFLIALFFCLKKDISYFNFLGLTGFLCLIYLVSVIVLQTKSYSDIYWK